MKPGNIDRREWDRNPVLEVLRPDPGWEVDYAILSSYSLELKVLALVLMELAGRGSATYEKPSNVDFACALENLRDRVAIIVQKGRIHPPRKYNSVFPILDRFIRQAGGALDEGIWHPKIALVRFKCAGGIQWRLWIGSRNFTTAANWDLGLTLISSLSGKGDEVSGVPELGEKLVTRAKLKQSPPPHQVRKELAALRWTAPKGFRVVSVNLSGGNLCELPTCPPKVKEVFVISPFLHPQILTKLSTWGGENAKRHLLSTCDALSRLKKPETVLRAFDTSYLASPRELAAADDEGESDRAPTDPLGLHAKLIAIGTSTGCVMWMGSANATEAAWKGRNFEVVAEVHAARKELEALKTIFDRSLSYHLDGTVPAADPIAQSLDEARSQVTRDWCVTQSWSDGCLNLRRRRPFHPAATKMIVHAGLLEGTLQPWLAEEDEIHIKPCELEQCSELLRIRLSLDGQSCEWIQAATFPDGLPNRRDEVVLFRYLSSQGFMTWLRAILAGAGEPASGSAWDEKPQTKLRPRGSDFRSCSAMLPALEDILKAWAAAPDARTGALHQANAVLERYAEQLNEMDPAEDDSREVLAAFRIWWGKVIAPLLQSAKS